MMTKDVLNTDNKTVNPSFKTDHSLRCGHNHLQENFYDDWISHLEIEDRDTRKLLRSME